MTDRMLTRGVIAGAVVVSCWSAAAAQALEPLLPDGVAGASRDTRSEWCDRAKAWAMTAATMRDEGLPKEKVEEVTMRSAMPAAAPVIRNISEFVYRHRDLEWDVATLLVSSVCIERHVKGTKIADSHFSTILNDAGECQWRYGPGDDRYVCLGSAMRKTLYRR